MIDGTFSGLLQAARFTVQEPRAAARAVIAMNLPMGLRWQAFALAITGSTVLTVLAVRLSPSGNDPTVQQVMASPIALAVMQGVMTFIAVQLMYHVGRLAGGRGSFADALILMTWLQIILMLVQVVQLGLEFVAIMAADVLGLFGLGLMFWLLTHFVAELHGFKSLGAVFAGIVGTAVAASFAVALLLLSVVGT